MTTALKIEDLSGDYSSVELNTTELEQVMGGNDAMIESLVNLFLHPNTELNAYFLEDNGNISRKPNEDKEGTFHFTANLASSNVSVTQQVDPNGLLQVVSRP